MGDNNEHEDVYEQLKQAHEHIRWLEQEVARLHRLLNNPWSFSDGFKTTKSTSDNT